MVDMIETSSGWFVQIYIARPIKNTLTPHATMGRPEKRAAAIVVSKNDENKHRGLRIKVFFLSADQYSFSVRVSSVLSNSNHRVVIMDSTAPSTSRYIPASQKAFTSLAAMVEFSESDMDNICACRPAKNVACFYEVEAVF